jgi:hypothetical protein
VNDGAVTNDQVAIGIDVSKLVGGKTYIHARVILRNSLQHIIMLRLTV